MMIPIPQNGKVLGRLAPALQTWMLALLLMSQPIASAQIRHIQPFRNEAGDPAWSATGSILFVRNGEIYLVHSHGDQCLTCGNKDLSPGRSCAPRWSKAGDEFLFINRGANSGVWRMNPHLKSLTAVRDSAAFSKLVRQESQTTDFRRVSPSGRNALFASTEGGWAAPERANDRSDYWLLPVDGSGPAHRMTWFNEVQNPNYIEGGVRVTNSSWSPDGVWLLAELVEHANQRRSRLVKIEFPEPE